MAFADNPLIPSDGVIAMKVGATTFTVQYEDGDFSVTGLKHGNKDTTVFSDRGEHYSVRKTAHRAVQFSFTAHAVGVVDAADASIPAVILRLPDSPWEAVASSIPAGAGDGMLTEVVWTGERTSLGGTTDTSLSLKYCDCETDFSEGIPGKFSVKGECYILASDAVTWT